MDVYQETFESWNKIATLYADKFMNLSIYNETYDAFCLAISKPQAKILEIGCGPGNITKYLLSKRQDFQILATDIAPNMVALAKVNNPSARFLVMDARQISQIEEKFDAIVCGFCIPYLNPDDCRSLIFDTPKLLNDDGLLYLSFVPGASTNSSFHENSAGDMMYFCYYNLDEINEMLWASGFHMNKQFNINYKNSQGFNEIHIVLIAGRPMNV